MSANAKRFDAKTLVCHIYDVFSREARRGKLYCSITNPMARVKNVFDSFASARSIKRYISEGTSSSSTLSSESTNSSKKTKIDEYDNVCVYVCFCFKNL